MVVLYSVQYDYDQSKPKISYNFFIEIIQIWLLLDAQRESKLNLFKLNKTTQ